MVSFIDCRLHEYRFAGGREPAPRHGKTVNLSVGKFGHGMRIPPPFSAAHILRRVSSTHAANAHVKADRLYLCRRKSIDKDVYRPN